ncbi:wax ester/triacylglycerol synthase family O-acyltransferase [Mycobacterium sp. NPDC051804]|uniref:wax ester/triacylglycerol synthase family O-acyltransferase n=1 Tax=Mycobacterium sp. NPDC051804 TaxID=3364295 RepID=UPI0037BBA418
MKRLNGLDALLVYSETPQIHMHTIKIGIFDVSQLKDGYTFDSFRRVMAGRMLGLAPMRYRLVDIPYKFHHPMWQENSPTEPEDHISRVFVSPPGGQRELDDLVGEIAAVQLPRDRPLWHLYVAEGLVDNRIAVILKMHHALADGVASANLIVAALRSQEALERIGRVLEPDVVPGRYELLRGALVDHLRQLARTPKLMWATARGVARVLVRFHGRRGAPRVTRPLTPPPSFLNHVVSTQRRFATASLALPDVKTVCRALGVTINDAVLAMTAGALRGLLLEYDGKSSTPLIAGVPVSLDKSSERLSGNAFGYVLPPLPVHIADAAERLAFTAQASRNAKENFRLSGPTLLASWLEYLPPPMAPAMFRWQSRRLNSGTVMNLTVSNVPGPREARTVDGAEITEIYSVGPLAAASGMNVTVWSYVDQLNISVLTDDITVNDPHEMTDAMIESFRELQALVPPWDAPRSSSPSGNATDIAAG